MSKIEDVTAYICKKYPHKQELSKARVTKLVYLSDWKSVQNGNEQLTDIEWYFHNYGPYVDDVIEHVSEDPRFKIVSTNNMYGDYKTLLILKDGAKYKKGLSSNETKIIDDVIEETRDLYWDSFIQHVYSTYPIKATDRHSKLNLKALDIEEKNGNRQAKTW